MCYPCGVREDVGLGILLLLGVAAIVGKVLNRDPTSPPPEEPPKLFRIAMVGGNDSETHSRVMQVIKSHGMEVLVGGGGRAGKWVVLTDGNSREVTQILRKDSKSRGYYIRFGSASPWSFGEHAETHSVQAPYSEILTRPEYAESTQLGACLRRPDIAKALLRYLEIDEIMYLRRPLFEEGKGESIVDELLVVQLLEVGTRKNRSSYFQVFEGENEVHVVFDGVISRN